MEFEIKWVDVTPNLIAQQQPVHVHDRPLLHGGPKAWAGQSEIARVGEFWVPDGDLITGQVSWSVTRIGNGVRIPIYAYRITRAKAALWAVGLQIGLAALADLRKHTNEIPTSIVLVLGHEVTDLAPVDDCYRSYVGIAIRTK